MVFKQIEYIGKKFLVLILGFFLKQEKLKSDLDHSTSFRPEKIFPKGSSYLSCQQDFSYSFSQFKSGRSDICCKKKTIHHSSAFACILYQEDKKTEV